ncbi:MAG: nickel-responsive transcriptional regulator NikR [Deltaproteobacteria bacterium]|jgi:CopG family nickel-responsive transcriptional regulator|nr:nickel-responsive transcriptional regulator NikR [Deltaproteobacteria bacterium]MDO9210355.1 nickel-responsive transcriptional regulator NikR [Deltaproteobacteria bacterium]
MALITRFGVSIEESLLKNFDRLISRKGYQNRSEALRDLIRESLVQEEWEEGKKETVGTIAIVYSHHTRELSRTLTEMQHRYYQSILSTLHIHLDEHNCLEVLVVKGRGEDIKKISERLIGTKGVKHGKLSLTTTGRDLG